MPTENRLTRRLQQIWLWMRPERLVLETEWAEEWKQRRYESHRRFNSILFLVIAAIYFSYYLFYDQPKGLQPPELWVRFRMSMAGLALFCAALLWWRPVAFSRFHTLPFFFYGILVCYFQARVMVWWPNNGVVDSEYVMIFVITIGIALRVNVFWSLLAVLSMSAVTFPTQLSVGVDGPRLWSNTLLSLFFTGVFRGNFMSDIKAFVADRRQKKLVQQQHESEQKLLKKELELTGAVQTLLLPQLNSYQSADGRAQLVGYYRAASECGGDWWWYKTYPDKIRVVVGDVTGHGAGPAVVTATLSAFMKALEHEKVPFKELIEQLRDRYEEMFRGSEYWLTVCAVEIHTQTNQVFSYFSAGPPVFVLNEHKKLEVLKGVGTPFGSTDRSTMEVVHELTSGGRVVLFTDGLYEARNQGRVLGMRKLAQFYQKAAQLGPNECIHHVVEQVDAFRADTPQEDDFTCVVVDLAPVRQSDLTLQGTGTTGGREATPGEPS